MFLAPFGFVILIPSMNLDIYLQRDVYFPQFTAYITFCAATIMFVYVVQNPKSSKRETVLKAAEKCFEIEKMLAGENNRMAQRYAAALEVLIIPAQILSDRYSRVYYMYV